MHAALWGLDGTTLKANELSRFSNARHCEGMEEAGTLETSLFLKCIELYTKICIFILGKRLDFYSMNMQEYNITVCSKVSEV